MQAPLPFQCLNKDSTTNWKKSKRKKAKKALRQRQAFRFYEAVWNSSAWTIEESIASAV